MIASTRTAKPSLLLSHPAEPQIRAHEMGIYKRYFDLIATGRKTTEIRVNDSSRKKSKKVLSSGSAAKAIKSLPA